MLYAVGMTKTATTTHPLARRIRAEVDFREKMTEVRKAPPAPARIQDQSDRPPAPPAFGLCVIHKYRMWNA